MKFILPLIILFSVVACEGNNKKSNETKNVSTLSSTKEDESISDEEITETPITTTPEIQTEEEPEIPNVVIDDPQLEPEPEPELPTPEEQQPEPEHKPEEESKPEPEIESLPETLPPIVIVEPVFDFTNLLSKGIHIVGRSILHEIRNPSAIYCSNTQHLNYEKAEELKKFSDTLQGEEIIVMDNIRMSVPSLKSLIEQAITTLQTSPQSKYCPRIYLAIESSR